MTDALWSGVEHRPFSLPGRGEIGALLIHGFAGSPAELRPLAERLVEAGIGTEGVLLPGFGPDIDRLGDVRASAWLETARAGWRDLGHRYRHRILIGFSLGGTLALHVAADDPPDRLVLLAPLWRMLGPAWPLGALLPAVRTFLPSVRPLARVDFRQPAIRDLVARASATIDLDDAGVQAALRDRIHLPLAVIDDLWRFAIGARRVARRVDCPTLVVQGASDRLVAAGDTRRLARAMRGRVELEIVDGDHLIVVPGSSAWPVVRERVAVFCLGRDDRRRVASGPTTV